jgi:hypothetical protein
MTYQVFDDKGERYELAAWRHGKLSDPSIRAWLTKKADAGCGVYVVASACDSKGRRRKNVVHARASFIDLDGEPLPDVWEVEPDIINETSLGKYHCFWLIQDETDLNGWSDCQARLAAFYTSDPKVFDPPRVVRLPGFYHQKNPAAVFRSKTLRICDASAAEAFERRQLADITSAHDCEYPAPAERAEGGRSEEPADGWDSPADVGRAEAYLANVTIPKIGNRNNAGYAVAATLNDFGISPELSFDLMRAIWNPRLPEELEGHELRHVIKSAGRYKEKSAGALSTVAAAEEFEDDEIEIPEESATPGAVVAGSAEDEFAAFMETPKKPADTGAFYFEGEPDFEEHSDSHAELMSSTLLAPPPRPKTVSREIGGISFARGDQIRAEPISWLWPWRIPRGKLTLIAGFPDQGKSQLMLKIAAIVTNGGEWPNGEGVAPKGAVIIMSSEDDEADTLIPRLAAAGAYLPNIYIVRSMVKYVDDGKKRKRVLNIEDDLRNLQAIIKKIHDEGSFVRMIGLDPINAYFGGGKHGKADAHKNSDMRALLTPIAEWAATLRVAIVAITHFNKGNAAHSLHRITDSGAITAAARSVYIAVKKHNDDPKAEVERIFSPMKHNIAPDAIRSIRYSIESRDVSKIINVPNPEWGTPYVEFGEADLTTAEEALNGGQKIGRKADQSAAAKDFIAEVLKPGVPITTKQFQASAKAAGVSWSTLKSVFPIVGAVAVKPKGSFTAQWTWVIDKDKAAKVHGDTKPDPDQEFEEHPVDDDHQEVTGTDHDAPDFG